MDEVSETVTSTIQEPKRTTEAIMDLGNVSDKVNINVGEGGSGGGSAAMIAALLNGRNQDSNLSPLIAALLNNRSTDGGFGGNGIWAILLLALLGRGRGGFGGGGDDCCNQNVSPAQAAILQTLMEGQSDLRAQVPTTALETQNAIQNGLAQLALGTQQGFSNVKDSVQLGIAGVVKGLCDVNQNVSSQGCQTREAVNTDGDRTRALLNARFQLEDSTALNAANARIVALETRSHHDAHHADTKLQISNTNSAVAAQAQAQQQQQQLQLHSDLRSLFPILDHITQVARATNSNVIAGNTGAVVTGPQTANPTNVHA